MTTAQKSMKALEEFFDNVSDENLARMVAEIDNKKRTGLSVAEYFRYTQLEFERFYKSFQGVAHVNDFLQSKLYNFVKMKYSANRDTSSEQMEVRFTSRTDIQYSITLDGKQVTKEYASENTNAIAA
ncbi:MAG: hypothetical protein ACRC9X_06405 [Bacteroidales bacterium]